MRNRNTLRGREGEKRVVRKFLIWPRSFDGPVTKWLCHADIVEQVCRVDIGSWEPWFCLDDVLAQARYAWKWCEVGFKNGGE